MKLELDKSYLTRNGKKAKVIYTEKVGDEYPVVALINSHDVDTIHTYTKDGRYDVDEANDPYDLVEEYSFWYDVEVDTPILVKLNKEYAYEKRHFAKYEDGKVYFWGNGKTSWTVDETSDVNTWKYAKLAEDGYDD